MKLVNRIEFLKLPNGILYSFYESLGDLQGLFMKIDSREHDWIYNDLTNNVDCNDSGEFADIMLDIEQNKRESFKLDLDCGLRDGFFEDNQLFVVYELDDVEKLLTKISSIAANYPTI
jgi:hypothetical protein